jgi:hypothetical protein
LEPRRVGARMRRFLKRRRSKLARKAEDPRGYRGYAT